MSSTSADEVTLVPDPTFADDDTKASPTSSPPKTFFHLATKLRSTTFCKDGAIVGRTDDGEFVVFPMSCKSWQCEACRPAKVRRWEEIIKLGRPNRMLTLTVDPSNFSGPVAAREALNQAWTHLVANIRKMYTSRPTEYVRIHENHASGWPHMHILLRSPWINARWIKKRWSEAGIGKIVDIRAIDPEDITKQAKHLVKYLGKQFADLCQQNPHKRMINRSRRWLSVEQTATINAPKIEDVTSWKRLEKTPYWEVISDLALMGCLRIDRNPWSHAMRVTAPTEAKSLKGIDAGLLCCLFSANHDPPSQPPLDWSTGISHDHNSEIDATESKNENEQLSFFD